MLAPPSLYFSLFLPRGSERLLFIFTISEGKISVHNALSNKDQPPANRAIISAHTHASQLHLQQVVIVFSGGWGGNERKWKKKKSFPAVHH